MALRSATESPDAITINELNYNTISTHKQILNESKYWHKFRIINVHGLNRNTVLKMFLEHIKPMEFIPLCYTEQHEGALFFARMCGPVIEMFCENKLSVPNFVDKSKPFQIEIILKHTSIATAKVDLSVNLLSVLQKRLNGQTLCLDNFVNDPDLTEFVPLSQSKLLAFVLNTSKKLKPKNFRLTNNEIKTLEALKIMSPYGIVSLDLRHNSIRDLKELSNLDNFEITELWLEGNPLCDVYDEYNYVQSVVKFCPKIEKLDGFLLRQNGVPSFRRNFLCNSSAYSIVNEFLELYFPIYDSRNFDKLKAFYHKDSLFSLTTDLKDQSSPIPESESYKACSRNLLNGSKVKENIFSGISQIMNLFQVLPQSEHDPFSFTVDVLYHKPESTIVVVTGVFREVPKVDKILGFSRYFVLEYRNDIYRIANEQMHISNALISQQLTAFKRPKMLHEARTSDEKNQMVNTFSIITNLTKDWAKMFLEEFHYNMKHAMLLFIDMYKEDKIPLQGFRRTD